MKSRGRRLYRVWVRFEPNNDPDTDPEKLVFVNEVVGGVIPKQDYQYLFDAGAVAVFGPGTKISDAAIKILEILIDV